MSRSLLLSFERPAVHLLELVNQVQGSPIRYLASGTPCCAAGACISIDGGWTAR